MRPQSGLDIHISITLIDHPIIEVDYPEAKILASFYSCKTDLMFVINSLSKLRELQELEEQSDIIITSLWNSALVAYARCFKSGIRSKLDPKTIFIKLVGDPLSAHEYFIALRDKHIAHSVNPYEQTKVGVILDGREKKVLGIIPQGLKFIYPDFEGFETFLNLSKVTLNFVEKKCEEYSQKTYDAATKDSVEKLYKNMRPLFIVPGSDQATKSRKHQ